MNDTPLGSTPSRVLPSAKAPSVLSCKSKDQGPIKSACEAESRAEGGPFGG